MEPQDTRAEIKSATLSPAATANRLLWIYLAIGAMWILGSDYLVQLLFKDNLAARDFIDSSKGLAFVLVTGLVMFKWLLQRELIHREKTLEELQFLNQLNEFSNDPVYVVDPADDFRLIHVNEAAVRHFGHSREKLLTMRIRDWDPAYAQDHAQENWHKLRTEKFALFESEHHLADGSVVPVEVSANFIEYHGKEYVGGYLRDISARKKAEKELRDSEERYHLALHGAGLGTWDWNIKTGRTIFNRRWAEMLGYRLEELEPDVKTWEKLVHPEDLPEAMKRLQNHFSGLTSFYTVEHRLKMKSGEWLWVLASGTVFERDADGHPVRSVGIHLDIDERKRADTLLHEQRAMLEGILNSIPQAVFWKDRTSRYLGCNRVFAEAAGLNTPEEIIGKTDLELPWGPREGREYIADDQAVMESRDPKSGIIEPITMADGKRRWLETSKKPLLSAAGEVYGVLGTFEDITVRKQDQEAVRQSEELFSGVFNSSLDALFLVDWTTRRVTNCNEQGIKMFEAATKADLIGQTGYEWHQHLRKPEMQEEIHQRVLQGERWQEEVEYKTLKGNAFWGQLAIRKLDLPDSQLALVRITNITNLKKMQEHLQQERDFSRWTMDVLPGVFYVIEADGRMRLWNPQLERVTGRTAEEINDTICLDLLHPDDREKVMKAIADALQQGEARIDARLMAKDGMEYPYHFLGRRIELDGSQCILGVGIDISERLTIEKELEHQLHFQQTLMDAIPVPVFIKNKQGEFQDCNPAGEKLLGLSRKELRGKTVAYFAPPELAKVYQKKDADLLEQGDISAYESKVKNAQGELREAIFHKAIFEDADGKVQGIVVALLDVTELKASNRRSELQESALKAAANGIVITDFEGKIVWANPAFTTLTGYSVEEVVGLTPQVLKSGRQSKEFYQQMWETIAGGHVWRGEVVNKRKDGSFYDEEMTITPVKNEAGTITNFIAIKQDVTQRKLLEAQYLRAQRMEGIGLLAGGIAHDLNNVLAPILMSVQLLEMMHPDQETRDILRNLQTSTERGADIVRQVLTFARGVKGERLLLTPKHLIKDMVRVAKEAFPRNIRITSNVPADLWNVKGDPTQLHQVLLNLAINARDAMPDGGSLEIDARNETVCNLAPEHGIQIADGDYVILVAKDTGMGIPPELHERIFEPFFTTKELGKGTGLGLSTVVGIVKSHHGYLRILSELGKGAEFLVYLPAVKDKVAAESDEETAPLPQGHGELIVVVDDEPGILEAAQTILEHQGYRVMTASDGTEGLSLVAQHQGKVKVVITDIMMPFMDGVALVRSLRKMAPEIRIIASSGLASGASMTHKVDELARLGVSPIMHKPFTAQKLLKNVYHILHDEPIEPEQADVTVS